MKNGTLDSIRKLYPVPVERPDVKPFRWSLDGGGRELVIDAAIKANVRIILEVGVFLGGSAHQWLEAMPDVTVIGVDSFGINCAEYFKTYKDSLPAVDLMGMTEQEFIEQMGKNDAQLLSVISNLWSFRDRFIPVKGLSPGVLHDLYNAGLRPDICYLDSDKVGTELEVFRSLWPDALICGDDWTHEENEGSGIFEIRNAVIPFAEKHRLKIIQKDATWILTSSNSVFANLWSRIKNAIS